FFAGDFADVFLDVLRAVAFFFAGAFLTAVLREVLFFAVAFFRAGVFFAAVFLADVFLAVVFFAGDLVVLRAEDFAEVFLAGDFLPEVFFAALMRAGR
ncbi:MAG TPA: hypothetical protein VM573_00655, partial [Actinomycetota bacterium]|nr:hypothetical protein [Actinomycetota bacterium]